MTTQSPAGDNGDCGTQPPGGQALTGAALRQLRLQAGLGVRTVARRAGGKLSDSHLSRVENGQRPVSPADGILFPDRITDDDDLLWASAEHDEQFLSYVRACRRGEGLPWNDRLPRDQWEAIREGLPVFGHLGESIDRLIPPETGRE